MQRKQFTFYQSYWKAVSKMSKTDRLAIYDAIALYGLFGTLPDTLTQRQEGIFSLIQPTLDSGRRKAENAMRSKGTPKTKQKQTENKKEIDKEIDNEINKEIDIELDIETQTETDRDKAGVCVCIDSLFDDFWDIYPNKLDKADAMQAWKEISADEATYDVILKSLSAWLKSPRWRNEDGRYIPTAGSYLRRGYWRHIPAAPVVEKEVEATCKLGQAELENIQRLLQTG